MKKAQFLLLLSMAGIIATTILGSKWQPTRGNSLITWDACGYYAYLPAYFYDDISHPDKIGKFVQDNNLMGGMTPFHYHPITGKAVMRYPIGEALGYLLAFVLAHFYAIYYQYPIDGFSWPYQFWMAMWGLFISLIGLVVLFKLLCRYFNPINVGITILLIVFGTNYLAYASLSTLHTHNLLFTLYACLCLLVDNWYKSKNRHPIGLFAIGMLCGWMAIIRPTDAISVVIPLFWLVNSSKEFKTRVLYFCHRLQLLIALSLGALLVVSIQLIYWHTMTGQWIYNSYTDQLNFSFLHPHLIDFLFSYMKGWLTYTPLMWLSLIGLGLIAFAKKLHWILILTYTVFTIYILSAWDIWWYGGSFSQRSMVQSYVLLSIPLTYCIQFIRQSRYKTIGLIIVSLFCINTNVVMTYQAFGTGVMESDCMTKSYFWKIFWRWEVPESDRKFIDVKYEMDENKSKSLKFLMQITPQDQDTTDATSLPIITLLPGQKETTILNLTLPQDASWVRLTADVRLSEFHWDPWRQTRLCLMQNNENQQILAPYRYIRQVKVWTPVNIDLKLKSMFDKQISVLLDNKEVQKSMELRNLKIYLLKNEN